MGEGKLASEWAPRLLSVLRIMAGLLFLEHGTAKIFDFPFVPFLANLPLASIYGVAAALEIVGGALLTLGLFTRLTAFVLSGEMAFAYFMDHAPQSFFPLVNNGTSAVLFCFVFLYLAAAGGGTWSLDAAIRSPRARQPKTTA